jgi:hypothetical protein
MYARINPFTALLELGGLEAVFKTVPPTPADTSYSVPTLWIDTVQNAAWMLLRVSGGIAYWALLATVDPYPLGSEAGDDLVTEAADTIVLN